MQKFFFKIIKYIFNRICSTIQIETPVKYYGTPYGGWYIVEKNFSKELIVFSAGVGEDISFDIEILNKFNSKIFFIDPTPKAIEHIDKVIENLGKNKSQEYDTKSGKQQIESYDLSTININNFKVIKKALFNKTNLKIKFFKPVNEGHVSHSISNFQNQFKKDTDYIEVTTITIKEIIIQNNIEQIDILKLDIEGAENQVIPDFLNSKIFPKQLLVEFDELSTHFIVPYLKALLIIFKLYKNSYKLIKTNSFPNFLFLRI